MVGRVSVNLSSGLWGGKRKAKLVLVGVNKDASYVVACRKRDGCGEVRGSEARVRAAVMPPRVEMESEKWSSIKHEIVPRRIFEI